MTWLGRSVSAVSASQPADLAPEPQAPADVAALIPMVRRIVGARVGAHPAADDLVQEILVRVLAASGRIEPGMLEPYAIVTARNVIASMWRGDDREKRNRHRVVDLRQPAEPDEQLLASEEHSEVAQALARLSKREREADHVQRWCRFATSVSGGASSGRHSADRPRERPASTRWRHRRPAYGP